MKSRRLVGDWTAPLAKRWHERYRTLLAFWLSFSALGQQPARSPPIFGQNFRQACPDGAQVIDLGW
jgi:hypothetical protein